MPDLLDAIDDSSFKIVIFDGSLEGLEKERLARANALAYVKCHAVYDDANRLIDAPHIIEVHKSLSPYPFFSSADNLTIFSIRTFLGEDNFSTETIRFQEKSDIPDVDKWIPQEIEKLERSGIFERFASAILLDEIRNAPK